MHRTPRARSVRAMVGGGVTAGLLLGVASLPTDLDLVVFGAFLALLVPIARGASPKTAALGGWACGLLYFGIGFGWIPAVKGGGWVAPVGYAVGVASMALLIAGYGATLALLRRRFGRRLALACAPGLWVAGEVARTQGSFGIPWIQVGYALAAHPRWNALADVGGLYLLSFWIVAVGALAAGAWTARRPHERLVGGSLLLALGCAPLLYPGYPADPGYPTPSNGLQGTAPRRTLRIGAVQPAIPAERRFRPFAFDANLRRLLELSDRARRQRAQLVVWPETAFERPLAPGGDPFLGAIAHDLGVPLLVGARGTSLVNPFTHRNTVALATPNGFARQVAEKVWPVPVYERAPEAAWQWWLARAGWWPGRVEPAQAPAAVGLAVGGERVLIGVLVCIDSSHPELARTLRRRGARLLVGLSNEAATGSWSARVHARIARLRAVENRVPFVRVANTGPSTWIDASGRVVARIREGRADARVRALPLAGPPPPYTRWGERPVLVVALVAPLVTGFVAAFQAPPERRRGGHERSPSGPETATPCSRESKEESA